MGKNLHLIMGIKSLKNFVDRSEDLGKSGGKKCNFDKEVRKEK